jgi:hypothetical protein
LPTKEAFLNHMPKSLLMKSQGKEMGQGCRGALRTKSPSQQCSQQNWTEPRSTRARASCLPLSLSRQQGMELGASIQARLHSTRTWSMSTQPKCRSFFPAKDKQKTADCRVCFALLCFLSLFPLTLVASPETDSPPRSSAKHCHC